LVTHLECLIDGVVASFQREADPGRVAQVGPQLADFLRRDGLALDDGEVIGGLTSGAAVLPNSAWLWTAKYPKANPVDHHLVAGWAELIRHHGASATRLAGSLFALEAVSR
jgi:hypothetical protein